MEKYICFRKYLEEYMNLIGGTCREFKHMLALSLHTRNFRKVSLYMEYDYN